MIKLIKNPWISTIGANVAVLLMGIATGVITARLLLPEGRGELAIVLFWPQLILGIGAFGLKEAITHRISSSQVDVRTVVASGLLVALGYVLLLCLVGYFVVPILLGEVHRNLLEITRTYLLIYFPIGLILLCLRSIDQGRLNYFWHNTLVVSVPAIYLLGLAILWYSGSFTVEHVVWANLASLVVVFLVRMVVGENIIQPPTIIECRNLIVTGLRFHSTAMVMLIGSQADRLVLIALWDNASIGLYTVAMTIASAGLGALSNSFQTVIFPNIGRIRDENGQRTYLSCQLRYAMVLLTGCAALIIAITPWLLPVIFGYEFHKAIIPAVILTLALVPYSLRQILIVALRGLGKAGSGTIGEAMALFIFLALVWPIGHIAGLAGIALSMLISNLISVLYMYRYLGGRLKLSASDWWGLNLRTAMQLFRIGRRYALGR